MYMNMLSIIVQNWGNHLKNIVGAGGNSAAENRAEENIIYGDILI